jgi:hypothetical protein
MMGERHLNMENLLALRDGEGSAEASAHVEACALCGAELRRLFRVRAELKALRAYGPPRDLWPRVAARIRRRRMLSRGGLGLVGLAAAAAIAAVMLVPDGPANRDGDTWVAEISSEDLGPVISRSRQLEGLLKKYDPGARVYDAPTALAVSVLEDRIAVLDGMLAEGRAMGADRAMMRGLWGERVETLEKLVELQLVTRERLWRPGVPREGGEGEWR